MRCDRCGNESDFKEILTSGIVQEITYKGGYIIEEVTRYKRDKNGRAVCLKCNKIFNEYEL